MSLPKPYQALVSAAWALRKASCANHRERACRQLDKALQALERPQADPVLDLARDMALVLLADYDEDPVAVGLVERARELGVIA